MQIGAQLCTLRELTQKSFTNIIKRIAEIGYAGVQISSLSDFSVQWVADTCAEYGLHIVTTHTSPTRIINETDEVIAEHKIYGAKQIGINVMPWTYQPVGAIEDGELRGSITGTRRFISDFTPATRKIRDAGLRLAYHNHTFEFEKFEGKRVLDYLIEGFAVDEMEFIIDVYWVQISGGDPAQWIRNLSGRVSVVYFKDITIFNGNEINFCAIGEGNLNWPSIIDACRDSGVEWVMVGRNDGQTPYERDDGQDIFDFLRISYEFLRKNI